MNDTIRTMTANYLQAGDRVSLVHNGRLRTVTGVRYPLAKRPGCIAVIFDDTPAGKASVLPVSRAVFLP